MSLPGIEQVAFSKIKGITLETAGAILAAVGSEAEFFRMSERELAELASAIFLLRLIVKGCFARLRKSSTLWRETESDAFISAIRTIRQDFRMCPTLRC